MNNPTLDMLFKGIGTTESNNNYNAIGPRTKNGNRAYGFSQVLDTNIAPWTKQFYGQELTPQQYLNTPEAQIAVTKGKLGELLAKYKNPQDVSSVWFSGRPLDKSVNASDGFLKTPEYIQRVMQNGGMPGSFNNSRTWQATGTDEQANAAQPNNGAPIASDAGEGERPLNNIGSTLANIGSIVSGLGGNRNAALTLGTANAANDLQRAESERIKEDTPQFVGFNGDKTEALFRKNNQIISRATGFTPNSEEPDSIKALRILQQNPDLLKINQEKNAKAETSNVDENGNWKYSTPVEDIDKKIERVQAGETLQSVMSRGNQKSRDDFNHRLVEKGIDPSAFSASAAEQAGKMNEFRKFGADLAVTERIAPKLMADIDIARQKLADYQKVAPTGNIVPLNKLMGMTQEQMTGPGAKELASLKTALKDVFDTHARYLGNGAITEASRQQSNDLASPFSAEPVTSAVLDTIASHTVRNQDFQRKGYANMAARNKKQALPYPELEIDPEAKSKKSTGLPSVGKKTTINGVEIERLE